ncbi:hypothetical protein EVAR_33497_1 [Eumeta japonica]|uniref:Uncharacterized protein n=1 Tax=Eumeta variegata TaxID=151549 RepID=A0A4C1WGV6_EUMVA|nr:hypothetical protein EVAR_33497_1 [Eumeta japonica]
MFRVVFQCGRRMDAPKPALVPVRSSVTPHRRRYTYYKQLYKPMCYELPKPLIVSSLHYIVDYVTKNLRSFESLGEPTDKWDTLTICVISAKIDPTTACTECQGQSCSNVLLSTTEEDSCDFDGETNDSCPFEEILNIQQEEEKKRKRGRRRRRRNRRHDS